MNTTTTQTLPTRLRAWRATMHLTQTEAAKRLGQSVSTLRNWEAGRRGTRLAPATREAIERVLGGGL